MQLRQRESKVRKNLKYIHNVNLKNVKEMYNSLLINHNEVLQKNFHFKINSAHAERKRYNKKLQFISFSLRRIFVFQTIFIIERFINHYTLY